ncbi:unnamed protein product [Owenia fusiformis]|uniref:Fucosyltransferase n=1 Tax=Owenia fusiformis TaxID=6347 RepID=A0A8S4NZU2_OWEFU|nr:unnamed protein product [Owenia fusiformis]
MIHTVIVRLWSRHHTKCIKLFVGLFICANLHCIMQMTQESRTRETSVESDYADLKDSDYKVPGIYTHAMAIGVNERDEIKRKYQNRSNVNWTPEYYYEDVPTTVGYIEPEMKTDVLKPFKSKLEVMTELKSRGDDYVATSGVKMPSDSEGFRIWPEQSDPRDDRIVKQLRFADHLNKTRDPYKQRLIRILMYHGWDKVNERQFKNGQQFFKDCPFSRCELTDDNRTSSFADAIIFRPHPGKDGHSRVEPFPSFYKQNNQVWVYHELESALNTAWLDPYKDRFNYTMTYRHDSDIPIVYGKFKQYDSLPQSRIEKNYAEGKTKKIAWFISHCYDNNGRMNYAKKLQEYIDVDIYGNCGDKECPRNKMQQCYEMLKKDYKFYLAFENTNCRDYITEKLFSNALMNDVVPVVMGAHPDDYRRVAPENSFIHVEDFPNPAELAEHINYLDQNDDEYNKLFQWKGTGEFINTQSWCRLCAMMHDKTRTRKWYNNLERWFVTEPRLCLDGRWDGKNEEEFSSIQFVNGMPIKL